MKINVITAWILVAGAAILIFWRAGSHKEAITEDRASGNAVDSSHFRSSRPAIRPAIDRLRDLPDRAISHAPEFERVERWVAELDDAELGTLIREVGMEDHIGLKGWLRCALFAEWGRRDPEAAMEYLKSLGEWQGRQDYARAQSWFSLFRGWASVDPEAAWADRGRFLSSKGRDILDIELRTADLVRTAIFKELARRDPDRAIQFAMAFTSDNRFRDPTAMTGILSGISSSPDLRRIIDDWIKEVWQQPDTIEDIRKYQHQMNSLATGFVSVPPEEVIISQAALILAEQDLDEAVAWLRTVEGSAPSGRINGLLTRWAERHPDEALQLIHSGDYRSLSTLLAIGALQSEPGLGSDVMAALDSESERLEVLGRFSSTLGNHHEDDFFPAPGKRNQLRDFQAEYQAVIETIQAAKLSKDQEATFLARAREEFAGHLALPGEEE